MNIHNKILNIIKQENINFVEVTETSDFYKDLGFNSLSFIKLIIEIEKSFSITFELQEIPMCLQVGSLISLVQKKYTGGLYDT